MRVLILGYNYYPEPIGIAPLITELAERLVARGHDVTVVTAFPNYPERRIYPGYQGRLFGQEARNGVKVVRHWVFIRPQPGLITRILFELSTMIFCTLAAWFQPRSEVILTVSPQLSGSLTAYLLAKRWGCPVVLNIQDLLLDAAIAVGLLKKSSLIRISQALEAFAYFHAQRIVVISSGFARRLCEKGVPPGKIMEIPNWVDVDFFRPLPKDNVFRAAHELKDKFVSLYSGNIALTQGLETVIKAANLVRDQPEFHFVIIGPPPSLPALQAQIDALALSNVLLLPLQERSRLPEILSASDCTLVIQRSQVVDVNMPSKIPVFLATGRPVIASVNAQGAAAKVIADSGGGLLIPPEDPQALVQALITLKADPDRCAAYGQAARNYAIAHFSLAEAVNAYERLFQSLLVMRS